MQKVFKRIASFGLAVAMCLGITAALRVTAAESTVVAEAATDYYAPITAQGGTRLLGQLHDLITTTHTTYTSYEDCKNYGPVTDPGLDGRGALEFYTHETIMSFSGNLGTWNREHVWCKSLSNGMWKSVSSSTRNGGTDMHHIRPSEGGLNSTRGSNKYGEVNGGKEAWSRTSGGGNSKLGGYIANGTFEPLDNVKGDVARIVMYVYTHYNTAKNVGGTTNGTGSGFGTLNFTHIMTASSEDAAKKLLLDWNRSDPVDEIERYRNEEVYKIQGNRNPFIDNSSYADAIWGSGSVDPNPPIDPTIKLESITINPASVTLYEGQSEKLTVVPHPADARVTASWTSSNQAVATVSSNGEITAKGVGKATIIATSTADASIWASVEVTVEKSSFSSATINIGSFEGMSGGYGFQKWSAGGIGGNAYIYGGNKDCMQFNVSKESHYLASDIPTPSGIKSVTVKAAAGKSANEWKLLTSSSPYGEVSGKPDTGNDHGNKTVTEEGVTWTVNGDDKYFALSYMAEKGAAYLDSIVVEYGGGGETPVPPAELKSISVNPASVTVAEGKTVKLTVTPEPASATADVEWTSSDNGVATVSPDGTVTAVAEGTATITAKSKTNPEIKATSTVTVKAEGTITPPPVKPESITINPSSLSLKQGASGKLTATVAPAGVNAEVEWKSSNEAVATVTADGTVTAIKQGTVTITATCKDNANIKATATVTVTEVSGTADAAKVEAFKNAVAAIPQDGTLSAKRTAVNAAITAYKTLSEADKAATAADIAKLNTEIAEIVKAYNAAADDAESNAISGASGFIKR